MNKAVTEEGKRIVTTHTRKRWLII